MGTLFEPIDPEHKVGDIAVFKGFFGLKEGQNNAQFLMEYRGLSETDRKQIAGGLRDGTHNY